MLIDAKTFYAVIFKHFVCFSNFGRKNQTFNFANIAATKFQSISKSTSEINGKMWYKPETDEAENNNTTTVEPVGHTIFVNKIYIENRRGNR